VRFLRKIQGFWAVVSALALFVASRPVIQSLDPSAGSTDFGVVHALIFGVCVFLLSIALSFFILQSEFPTLDEHMDSGRFLQDWRSINPQARVAITVGVIISLFFGAILAIRSGL
jgi:hypothetical protein